MIVEPARYTFLAAVLALEGLPYRWGGKGPAAGGIDCSGLVAWAAYVVGGLDVRHTHNSDRLWAELLPIDEPQPADLAFYGRPGDPSHVVVCLGGLLGPVIGANGGDSTTTTPQLAAARDAKVKRKPHPRYRPDLLGFRSIDGLLKPRELTT